MSALRPHIRAARAYEAAYREARTLVADPRTAIDFYNRAEVHRRAAEIMEAEEAAEATNPLVIHRQSAGQTAEALAGWPVQREGC